MRHQRKTLLAVLMVALFGVFVSPTPTQAAVATFTPGHALAAAQPSGVESSARKSDDQASKRVRTMSSDVGTQVIVVGLRNQDGRWEEFWRGSDCALWHRWQLSPGGAWSGIVSMGGCLAEDVDGQANADGRLEIFGRSPNQAMYHIWQTTPNCCWSAWTSMGGILTSNWNTWKNSYGGIVVDGQSPNGYWYRNYQKSPSCCYSGWFQI
ncbi:hypothetical protein [Micromonospora sp. NPDC048830]|uniref:hypothetical protein n=1 Tax=Micromonospora sp. NPDC048830 TaxID=3364257 RepID=UPI0037184EDF